MTIRFKDGERYKKDAIPTNDRLSGLEIIANLISFSAALVAYVILMEILSTR